MRDESAWTANGHIIWRKIMTHSIQPSCYHAKSAANAPCQAAATTRESFMQSMNSTQAASISITTAQGDLVTLSSLSSEASRMSSTSLVTPVGYGQEFTLSQMQSEFLSISVQGDLNAEELADIQSMVQDLTDIAGSFFNGYYDQEKINDFLLKDMGSLSTLSASFTQRSIVQTQMVSHHPIPALAGDLMSSITNDPVLQESSTKETDQGEMLKARWSQMMSLLDNGEVTQEQKAENAMQNSKEATALKMMERMQETLQTHPRLSPFAIPLANKAMNRAAHQQPHERHAETSKAYRGLSNELYNRLQRWLNASGEETATAET